MKDVTLRVLILYTENVNNMVLFIVSLHHSLLKNEGVWGVPLASLRINKIWKHTSFFKMPVKLYCASVPNVICSFVYFNDVLLIIAPKKFGKIIKADENALVLRIAF